MFENITAQNPRNNATLMRAHQVQADLIAQGLSKNPRIYADQFTMNGAMIPETATQNNSDLPGWATQWYDGSTTLESLGVPSDLPLYLVILVVEGGSDNFCDVAEIDHEMSAQGKTLAQAVNLAKSTN